MRKILIAANWKMHKDISESQNFLKQLIEKLGQNSKFCSCINPKQEKEIMIAPNFTSIYPMKQILKDTEVIRLGAQNLFYEDKGAFTGEVSPSMLKSAGAEYVIIGHSERRHIFGETNQMIAKKIKKAIESNLMPIFCIGETLEEREKQETFTILDKQVRLGLENADFESLKYLTIAYEPVWAIGTGKAANSQQIQEVHKFLRSLIKKMYNEDFANEIKIIYGGSVKPSNTKELMGLKDVDGALIGGASLELDSFLEIFSLS